MSLKICSLVPYFYLHLSLTDSYTIVWLKSCNISIAILTYVLCNVSSNNKYVNFVFMLLSCIRMAFLQMTWLSLELSTCSYRAGFNGGSTQHSRMFLVLALQSICRLISRVIAWVLLTSAVLCTDLWKLIIVNACYVRCVWVLFLRMSLF